MKQIRNIHRNGLLFWLLALTVGLRSLIAPGFMLETNGDGPLGLGIVLCEGLNGALPLQSAQDDPHAAHQHHGGGMAGEETASGMSGATGATCGLWSTSSTFVQTLVFVSDHLIPEDSGQLIATIPVLNPSLFRLSPQQPRAPPVLS